MRQVQAYFFEYGTHGAVDIGQLVVDRKVVLQSHPTLGSGGDLWRGDGFNRVLIDVEAMEQLGVAPDFWRFDQPEYLHSQVFFLIDCYARLLQRLVAQGAAVGVTDAALKIDDYRELVKQRIGH